MKKNVELTPEIIKAVYDDIMNKHGMTKREVCDYITQCSNCLLYTSPSPRDA